MNLLIVDYILNISNNKFIYKREFNHFLKHLISIKAPTKEAIWTFSLLPYANLYSISAILLIKNIFMSSVYLVFKTHLCKSLITSSTAKDFLYFNSIKTYIASLYFLIFKASNIISMSSGDGLPVTSYTSYKVIC